jgi:hypothetical protein
MLHFEENDCVDLLHVLASSTERSGFEIRLRYKFARSLCLRSVAQLACLLVT